MLKWVSSFFFGEKEDEFVFDFTYDIIKFICLSCTNEETFINFCASSKRIFNDPEVRLRYRQIKVNKLRHLFLPHIDVALRVANITIECKDCMMYDHDTDIEISVRSSKSPFIRQYAIFIPKPMCYPITFVDSGNNFYVIKKLKWQREKFSEFLYAPYVSKGTEMYTIEVTIEILQ